MTLNARPLRIGLLYHSLRSDNLGIGALTISELAILRAAAERAGRPVKPVVIGYSGSLYYPTADPTEEFLIEGWSDLAPASQMWRTIGGCDALIDISAGDSFADIYGWHRFTWMAVPKAMALIQRRPLVLAPQTIGPFTATLSASIARLIMRRCAKVYARDRQSRDVLESMGIKDRIGETVDVAFRLPYEPKAPSLNQGGPIKFGFNVSGLLYNGGYTGKNQFGLRCDYRALVAGIIGRLSTMPSIEIHLVPHVIPTDMPVEDDFATAKGLQKQSPGLILAPRFRSPSEAKTYISGLHILAGSRMHATIAAVSSNTAVVPLAYSRKFSGVFQSIGYPLLGDCTAQETDELVELTLGAVGRIAELREAARRGNEIAQTRLVSYENFLAEFLSRLP